MSIERFGEKVEEYVVLRVGIEMFYA